MLNSIRSQYERHWFNTVGFNNVLALWWLYDEALYQTSEQKEELRSSQTFSETRAPP